MPKRARSQGCIEGLSTYMIKEDAAYCSFERGEDLKSSVVIDSHSKGKVEASITGKYYDISISYTAPVSSSLDLDCDCTCPDDRGGSCKHICAVLLCLVDTRPKAKKCKAKKLNNPKPMKKKYSETELKNAIRNLEERHLFDILEEALEFKEVQKIVTTKLNSIKDEEIDLSSIKLHISEAVHQLDRLRPSQQFSMSHQAENDLNEIVSIARRYLKAGNSSAAMQILLTVAKGVSNESMIEGECGKPYIAVLGSTIMNVSQLMEAVIENDADLQRNERIKRKVRALHENMSGYGIQDYGNVLECFDSDIEEE